MMEGSAIAVTLRPHRRSASKRRIQHQRDLATRKLNRDREIAAAEHRRTDKFEQAKSFLQRRGYIVHSVSVIGERGNKIAVGSLRLTKREVIAMAKRMQKGPANER